MLLGDDELGLVLGLLAACTLAVMCVLTLTRVGPREER